MGAAVYGRSRAWALPYGAPVSVGSSSLWRGHEPAGMAMLDQRQFNTLAENASPHSPAWDTDGPPGVSIFSDSSAIQSPPNVLRFTYQVGHVAGTAPGHTGVQWAISPNGHKHLYVCLAQRFSASWEGQSAGTNKIWYAKRDADAPWFISGWGAGSNPLVVKPVLQNCVVGNGVYDPNQGDPTAHFTRGNWGILETYLIGNTAGNADGSCTVWLDGVKTHSITGVQYTTDECDWDLFDGTPVWGGTGLPNVSVEQYQDWDELYISVKH